MAKHKCSEKVPEGGRSVSFYPCQRPATVQRDGKWYCWQHDPEYVAKKTAERRAGWQAKMDREAAKYARIACNAKLAALVTPGLALLLIGMANIIGNYNYPKMAQEARKLAAKIREALDE